MPSKLELTTAYIEQMYSGGEEFRFDTLSRKIQILQEDLTWRNLTDKDVNTIACDCAQATNANITDREVRIALGSNLVHDVHPLRDWVKSLKPYQPGTVDWIEFVSAQVKVVSNQETWAEYFRKWFVAMVASWMYDHVVNHQVLVLIGRQGTGKTTWLEHLLPPELRDYVTKQASVRELTKDDRIRVAEFGLINMDEIDSCSSRELNVLKSLITTADVNERAAYGHNKERRVRCASFCASGNNREFLSDDTGNRRWLPFEVESIQNPFCTTLPYERMYAQAWYLIQNGFNYWFDLPDIEQLETHNEAFRQTHYEEELLKVYFEPCEKNNSDAKFMTASEIQAKIRMWGYVERPISLEKFGRLLNKMGYVPYKSHGKKGYVVKILQQSDSERYMAVQDAEILESGVGGVCTF
ncbi:MAG: DUF5906 domain-containing protein [Paludibacteraceae bacterium]|nr:DUF5906 domain-containing protein [Paludibacteraceae bacterium]